MPASSLQPGLRSLIRMKWIYNIEKEVQVNYCRQDNLNIKHTIHRGQGIITLNCQLSYISELECHIRVPDDSVHSHAPRQEKRV